LSTLCPVVVNIIVLSSGFSNVGFVVIAVREAAVCVLSSYGTCVKFFLYSFLFLVHCYSDFKY
jgi:hypothetical protein